MPIAARAQQAGERAALCLDPLPYMYMYMCMYVQTCKSCMLCTCTLYMYGRGRPSPEGPVVNRVLRTPDGVVNLAKRMPRLCKATAFPKRACTLTHWPRGRWKARRWPKKSNSHNGRV